MLLVSTCTIFFDVSFLQWSSLQIFKSVFHSSFKKQISSFEESLWLDWEKQNTLNPNETLLSIPTYTSGDKSALESINFRLPFIIQNMSQSDVLSLKSLSTPPLSDLSIDYFSDARKKLLVPDRYDTLAVIMENILAGGPEKIGHI